MARSCRTRRHAACQLRPTPYPIPSYRWKARKDANPKKALAALQKKDWEDAVCPVCIEYPHNAVLLLCSSHDKGCRPYMCGTSIRHSNCLDQFKKAYSKAASLTESAAGITSPNLDLSPWSASEKTEVVELACPLCRGQVKGWTVVEPARTYLNGKRRTCMQDGCSFVGTYKELHKHVHSDHPCAKPRVVDPVLEEKWRNLEHERERQDVISTITSSTPPGSFVIGDYVIEMGNSDDESDDVGRGPREMIYLIMRETAQRLMSQDNGASENGEGNYVFPLMGGFGANITSAYALDSDDEEGPVIPRGRDLGVPERRRLRRRRSRGRSFSASS